MFFFSKRNWSQDDIVKFSSHLFCNFKVMTAVHAVVSMASSCNGKHIFVVALIKSIRLHMMLTYSVFHLIYCD